MRLSGAFLLAQAALGVALVIPTKLDISHEDLAMAMARSRIVRLDCTGCPGEGRQQLLFDFRVAVSRPDTMTINSKPIFPVPEPATPESLKLKAPMLPHGIHVTEYFNNPDAFEKVDVGYTLLFTSSKRFFPTPSKIHSFELQILSVSHQPVTMEGIALDIAEDVENSNLAIGPSRIMPVSEQCGADFKCLTAKLKSKLSSSAQSLKSLVPGCGGNGPSDRHRHGHGFHPSASIGHDRTHHPHEYPQHRHGPHRGHGFRGPRQSFMERAVEQILLPIFIGLCAGMLFGAFVLAVVHGASAVLRRIRSGRAARRERRQERRRERRERRAARRAERKQAKKGASEEKGRLMEGYGSEDIEAPPAYIDAEIGEGLEVVDQKQ